MTSNGGHESVHLLGAAAVSFQVSARRHPSPEGSRSPSGDGPAASRRPQQDPRPPRADRARRIPPTPSLVLPRLPFLKEIHRGPDPASRFARPDESAGVPMVHAGVGSFSRLAARFPRSSTTVTSTNLGDQRGRRARTRRLFLQPLEGCSGHRDREGGFPPPGLPPRAAIGCRVCAMQCGDSFVGWCAKRQAWCVRAKLEK